MMLVLLLMLFFGAMLRAMAEESIAEAKEIEAKARMRNQTHGNSMGSGGWWFGDGYNDDQEYMTLSPTPSPDPNDPNNPDGRDDYKMLYSLCWMIIIWGIAKSKAWLMHAGTGCVLA